MPSCETPIATDIPPAMNTPPMAERAVRTSVLLAATIEQFGGTMLAPTRYGISLAGVYVSIRATRFGKELLSS
ncbi:hypothetical protein GCM10008023_40160 [Sphingomonas glacialis]|uniref:Uncharacterized protein n=1 Tax=Sphingomonas glacialis TaxID=658225 RepID=A0ABQ3M3R0_9SPHN|nr:hypothetical protein GCM10008023_40160 [Sphingomonas glacialis]